MRLAYLDCFAGISGDMFLGALLGAGVPPAVLRDATGSLDLGASLGIEIVDRSGISCTKVHVLERGVLAEATHQHPHAHDDSHPQDDAVQQGDGQRNGALTQQPRTQHLHKTGHAHPHEPERAMVAHRHEPAAGHEHAHRPEQGHVHGRPLTEIRALIRSASLDDAVKRFAVQTFELLGAAEAKIHNVAVDDIHFHEVGAVDAIVDIVAASAGIHHLRMDAWHCSPINVGGGTVLCAHGRFPVPAPATADLLRGMPTYAAHVEQELVTPTGAALLRALNPTFGPQPAMEVGAIGYGGGTRNPPGFANVLRLSIGEQSRASSAGLSPAVPPISAPSEASGDEAARSSSHGAQTVTVIETALDDLSPQVIAYVSEQAFALGALDVMLTPVVMKKGRPGTLLTVLCDPAESGALQALLLRETSTLGVRLRQEQRVCLARRHTTVTTAYGPVRIKVGMQGDVERNAAPEFEDCRAAAQAHNVPLKQVQQAALAAYLR